MLHLYINCCGGSARTRHIFPSSKSFETFLCAPRDAKSPNPEPCKRISSRPGQFTKPPWLHPKVVWKGQVLYDPIRLLLSNCKKAGQPILLLCGFVSSVKNFGLAAQSITTRGRFKIPFAGFSLPNCRVDITMI